MTNTKAAQAAASLVRRWEDCIAPHDLPRWAEEAALTMRALLAQQPAPHTPAKSTQPTGDVHGRPAS